MREKTSVFSIFRRKIVVAALIICIGSVLTGCHNPSSSFTPTPLPAMTEVVIDDTLGLAFNLPAHWQLTGDQRGQGTRLGSALVFSGSSTTPEHYTTITIQAVQPAQITVQTASPSTASVTVAASQATFQPELHAASPASLPAILARMYTPVAQQPQFTWLYQTPLVIGQYLALAFAFDVEHHESMRRKWGILLDTGEIIVEFAYNAPLELFDTSLYTYEQALDTLTIFAEAATL